MGSLPLTLAPKGKLALPPNPITHSLLTGPKPSLQDQRNQQSKGLVADIAARRAQLEAHPVHGSVAGTIREFTGADIHGFAHPLAALEGKGEFAPTKVTFDGHKDVPMYGQPLPFFGGSSVLKDAGEAIVKRSPEEAAQHVLEVAGKAKAEGFGKKAADVLVAPSHEHVAPHVSTAHESVDGFVDRATVGQPGYVYHRTSVQAFKAIAKDGLKASSESGDLRGVYFGSNPLAVSRFANKGADSVYLRARETVVPDLGLHPNKAYGEMITPHDVPPQNLEYLGADGSWHPLESGVNLSETERAAQVRGALEGAPAARGTQKILQSAERGKRFAASAAEAQKHEGVAAYHAAVGQLRGKLPQINYKGFTELDAPTLNALLEDVKNHPTLMQGQKITAQRSLLRAVGEGKAPTVGEEKILRTVFGDTVTEQIKSSVGFFKTYKNLALDAANIPRAIMSSADLSAPLRQGLVAMTTHPVISLKAFPKMIKMFGSENLYQASRDAIENDPLFPLAMKAELPLTGIGVKDASTSLIGREEAYQSNLAERLNLREIKFLRGMGKMGTGPGDLIRASDRAYTGYLNQVRMDIFKSLAHDAAEQGRDVNNTKLIKDIARFVGSATGRGPLGPLKNHAVSINALFFSPKLLASRLDILLSPVTYLHADPFVRRQALEATFKLVGTMSLVLYVAKLGGAQVGLDPTNADFAKIRIGNTRIDIAGGFQQPVRLAFELAEGKVTSSTTGKSMALSGGIGKTSSGDVALRFLMGKAAPVPGFVLQASGVSQASFGPHQATWKLAVQKLLPLLAQDANDLRTTPGAFGGNPSVGKAIAGYGLGVFGVGEQTYAPKTPKPRGSGGSGGYGDTGGSYGGGSGGYGDTGGSYGGG